MKKLLLVFAVAGMVFGFSSCKDECCDCSGVSGLEDEYCEGDGAGSNLGWDISKASYESAGCDCD